MKTKYITLKITQVELLALCDCMDSFSAISDSIDDDSFGMVAWINEDSQRVGFTLDRQENFWNDKELNLNSFRLTIDREEMNINQWQLFQKLAEWHINFLNIPEGLYIDKSTLNL